MLPSNSYPNASIPRPSVRFGLPHAKLFLQFQSPNSIPVISVQRRSTWDHPIYVEPPFVESSLNIKFPALAVIFYLLIVPLLNRVNKRRGFRPWLGCRTAFFRLFVLAHNVFLAILSLWVFLGMCKKIHDFLPTTTDRNYYLAQTVDLLCNLEPHIYLQHEEPIGLLYEFASFVWVFYLSKIYELVDTLILLAKGKQATTLQIYHHAGIVMCGWLAIRCRSPPAVPTIILNSGIHTLMYSYYALKTMNIHVPLVVKKNLTRMQIAQFFIALLLGWLYFFAKYDIPLNVDSPGKGESNSNTPQQFETIPCLNTSGVGVLGLIGTLYVVPLACLFVQFFVKSYNPSLKRKMQ
ncbi:hypothetical protein FQN57_004551 [Myotisia sp. PD_48]|nr:hypothetical protein FQN57_004551 [Myotisia sp. PD_48]